MPKLVTVLREGYAFADFHRDLVAGLTVAIVALPLSMALAIASGTTPDKGLVTAVIAGFLISALGGSRFQIGGPTGAFVVVVFNVIAIHGYDGLVIASAMAGLMLIGAGLMRVGTFIKYIPEPVVTGFTAGIAVIIATSQIKDFLGLSLAHEPAEFIEKVGALAGAVPGLSPQTFVVGLASPRAHRLAARQAALLWLAVADAALSIPSSSGSSRPCRRSTIGPRFSWSSNSSKVRAPCLPGCLDGADRRALPERLHHCLSRGRRVAAVGHGRGQHDGPPSSLE